MRRQESLQALQGYVELIGDRGVFGAGRLAMVLNEQFIEMDVAVKVAQIADFLGLEVSSKDPAREFGGVDVEIGKLRNPLKFPRWQLGLAGR